jgi:hypothetical protein
MMLDDFAEGYLGIFGDARQSDMEVRDTLRSIEDAREADHYREEGGNVKYDVYVNDERTVLVRLWASGEVEVALRESPADGWGPPIMLTEERHG